VRLLILVVDDEPDVVDGIDLSVRWARGRIFPQGGQRAAADSIKTKTAVIAASGGGSSRTVGSCGVRRGRSAGRDGCPLSGEEQKTYAQLEVFRF
jgi:hypothetical protein